MKKQLIIEADTETNKMNVDCGAGWSGDELLTISVHLFAVVTKDFNEGERERLLMDFLIKSTTILDKKNE